MKWYKNKWYISGIIVILIAIALWHFWQNNREGFQTISNVQYPIKEVFLVAPNFDNQVGKTIIRALDPRAVPSDDTYKTRGYTWEEAQKMCKSFGGDLVDATTNLEKYGNVSRLQQAYDISGNWCLGGWTLKDQNNLYYLANTVNKCGQATVGVKNTPAPISEPTLTPVPAPGEKKGFAICDAPKPPYPTINVNYFNPLNYSMFLPTFMGEVMSGIIPGNTGPSDVFPLNFTPSQVNYAIEAAGYDKTNKKYNSVETRKWLVTNYRTVDQSILSATEPSYSDTNDNNGSDSAALSKSCDYIKTVDEDIGSRLKALKGWFADISGSVTDLQKSKKENSTAQAILYRICSNTTPKRSPACAKLATLDYETFYTRPTVNILSDMETINYNKYQRQEELCADIYNIRLVKRLLNCTYTLSTLNSYTDCNGGNRGCNASGSDCSGTNIFDSNNVQGLKYALQNISPLFSVDAYKTIVKTSIDRIAGIIELPSINAFTTSNDNTRLTNLAFKQVENLFPVI
jgi:hypothetical protein